MTDTQTVVPEAPTGADATKQTPVVTNQSGTDPSKTEAGDNTTGFNPSTIKDDDFAKLYDDPRLYQHPKFKKLIEKAKSADTFEAERARMEEESLKKKGEFETLAQKKAEEAALWQTKYTETLTENSILSEAAKLGIQGTNVDAVKKLIDRSKISVDEDGAVQGITEALNEAIKAYPNLLTINRSTVGSGTNPTNHGNSLMHKMSDIANPAYYREHEADISRALNEGRVIEDRV